MMRLKIGQLRHLLREGIGPGGYTLTRYGEFGQVESNIWLPFFDKFRVLFSVDLSDVAVLVRNDPDRTQFISLRFNDPDTVFGTLFASVSVLGPEHVTYHLAVAGQHDEDLIPVSLADFLACQTLDDLPEELAARVFTHVTSTLLRGW
jgi:hypothetical protein